MSNAFVLAAVSAVLRRLLIKGLGEVDLTAFGNVATTALPPDRISTGQQEAAQLNLFLYQVTPNAGWRNVGLPSRGSGPDERLTNPLLALDLHYLLTAYGAQELHPEALLGYAMQVFHEVPVLTRDFIRKTWPAGGVTPVEKALAGADLANQIEQIKITPHVMHTEEMSKLWSVMGAKYRPSSAYCVSVVLIEARKAAKSPLPVLKQGDDGTGPTAQADLVPPFPEIESVTPPKNQTAALLGDDVGIGGHDFAGEKGDPTLVTVAVRFANARLQLSRDINVPSAARTADLVKFKVPNEPANIPAGVWTVTALVTPNGKPLEERASNVAPLLVAPAITSNLQPPVNRVNVDPQTKLGDATVALTCSPEVRPGQRVELVLGSRTALAEPLNAQGPNLTFKFKRIAAGKYRVRLRVDGLDSLLIDRSDPANPKFDDTQQITIT